MCTKYYCNIFIIWKISLFTIYFTLESNNCFLHIVWQMHWQWGLALVSIFFCSLSECYQLSHSNSLIQAYCWYLHIVTNAFKYSIFKSILLAFFIHYNMTNAPLYFSLACTLFLCISKHLVSVIIYRISTLYWVDNDHKILFLQDIF